LGLRYQDASGVVTRFLVIVVELVAYTGGEGIWRCDWNVDGSVNVDGDDDSDGCEVSNKERIQWREGVQHGGSAG
jgi:hypothetical protein